jgi:peroxin-16
MEGSTTVQGTVNPPNAAPLQNPVKTVKQIPQYYKNWVVSDPEQTSRLETIVRILGYAVPVRLGLQQEHTEIIYAASNFLSFVNDRILAKYYKVKEKVDSCKGAAKKVVYALSILDLVEVAVELFVQSKSNEAAKWIVVLLIVIVKVILQAWLVFKKKYGILTTPPIGTVDRSALRQEKGENTQQHSDGAQGWRGPRTGKVIRSIHGDPSIPYPELLPEGDSLSNPHTPGETTLKSTQLVAEALHIARPLAHVVSMFAFGQTSWTPWLVALGMDVASLQLMGKLTHFKKQERSELLRRRTVLLLYLLRSPFFDTVFKVYVLEFLKYLSSKLPLIHYVLDPLLEYLPVWQKIYFYNWMS